MKERHIAHTHTHIGAAKYGLRNMWNELNIEWEKCVWAKYRRTQKDREKKKRGRKEIAKIEMAVVAVLNV